MSFGILSMIKSVMGFRQFSLRELDKVRGHQQQANDVLGKIAEEYAIGSPIPSIRAFYLAPSGRDSGGPIKPRFKWLHRGAR